MRYADRMLSLSAPEAAMWGQLCAGVEHVSVDPIILVTAKIWSLTVVTRNLRHYTVRASRRLT